ncbi:MAG: EAL domain-containing protein [Alphaproteobacteria bacterium]|nr:EAL domain-containing protein [Alphaproteobacteria bacterium]
MAEKGQKVIPEQLLLDTLDRLRRVLSGFTATHLHLSSLRSQNRKDVQLRIVVRMFDQIIASSRGRIFTLTNNDIIILGKDINKYKLERTIDRIRNLFQNDPLVYADPEDNNGHFTTWYNLENGYNIFYDDIERALNDAKESSEKKQRKSPASIPIEPEHLDKILKILSTINVSSLIRRQCVVSISPQQSSKILFQEFYTSMADMKRVVAPEINLFSDRWLFQHLSCTLDKKLLPVLMNTKLHVNPPAISLNLNISTVFTSDFQSFMRKVKKNGQQIIVEVQMMDVFQNIRDYKSAKKQLHDNGHKILLDGLSSQSLQFIDLNLFNADFIKIIWSPTLTDKDQNPDPKQLIKDFGSERVVMARCDTEDSIKWGLSAGVTAFQGYFIDSMAGAMTKSACKNGEKCSLSKCVASRATISGKTREQCTNQKMLDELPKIKAL